jgi:hypothetical protein
LSIKNERYDNRKDKQRICYSISNTAQVEQMQDLIDYLRYKELTSAYSVNQQEVDTLAREINSGWWNKNQDKFSDIKQ